MLIHRLKLFVPASVVVLSVMKIAGGAELPTELIDCRALASSVGRLDCYDQLVDAHAASTNQATENRAAEKPTPAAALTAEANVEPEAKILQEDLFGKDASGARKAIQEATGAKEIDQLEARVAKVRKSRSGKTVITLDNGQVWMQTDSSRARVSSNDMVTIRRASFGSYMMHVKKTAMRVKRIS